jgi:hypothetical protein
VRWRADPCDGEHLPRRAGDASCDHPAALERDRMQRAALERGDDLVQHLAIAKYALSVGDTARAMTALDTALGIARHSLSELVSASGPAHAPSYAGSLIRSTAAGT